MKRTNGPPGLRLSDRMTIFYTDVAFVVPSICADNVRGSLIRLGAFPTIRYHIVPPYPDANSDNHSYALSPRSCASRIMYSYSRVYARTISVRSRDKYPQRPPRIPPRRWNAIFARGSLAESRIRVFPPAATGLQSITRVRYSRNSSAIIHCVCAYDPRWFTRADVTHPQQFGARSH